MRVSDLKIEIHMSNIIRDSVYIIYLEISMRLKDCYKQLVTL